MGWKDCKSQRDRKFAVRSVGTSGELQQISCSFQMLVDSVLNFCLVGTGGLSLYFKRAYVAVIRKLSQRQRKK